MKLFLIFLLHFPAMAIVNKNRMNLNPTLKSSYLELLNQASDFHKAIHKGDKKDIQNKITETQEIIAELYRKSSVLKDLHIRIHSHKLFNSIEEQLNMISHNVSLKEDSEKKVVKKLFNSFLELAQVYDLTKDMKPKAFYCKIDKSLWFQTANEQAQNPINPSYKNCAIQVL